MRSQLTRPFKRCKRPSSTLMSWWRVNNIKAFFMTPSQSCPSRPIGLHPRCLAPQASAPRAVEADGPLASLAWATPGPVQPHLYPTKLKSSPCSPSRGTSFSKTHYECRSLSHFLAPLFDISPHHFALAPLFETGSRLDRSPWPFTHPSSLRGKSDDGIPRTVCNYSPSATYVTWHFET